MAMLMRRYRSTVLQLALGLSGGLDSAPQWGDIFPASLQPEQVSGVRAQVLEDFGQARLVGYKGGEIFNLNLETGELTVWSGDSPVGSA